MYVRVPRMSATRIVQVAIPTPLRQVFDYLLPSSVVSAPQPGTRVRVPFGRRQVIGVALAVVSQSQFPVSRLKPIIAVIDTTVVDAELLALLRWSADYYHHPIGEVLHMALPALLRQGHGAEIEGIERFHLTSAGRDQSVQSLKRAPLQKKIWEGLSANPQGLNAVDLAVISANWRSAMRVLQEKEWVTVSRRPCWANQASASTFSPDIPPNLHTAQTVAVDAIISAAQGYHCFLLYGVTGSGKTEVYLHAIANMLARNRQVLVLVPEIGLTPQLVDRFRRRFATPIAVFHSALTDSERLCAWSMARLGHAAIVIGTRSAVFTPFKNLGLIVVDEEHDLSYKQHDGFRYHARDVAIMRANRGHIPIILGSATPALESLYNARLGRYRFLTLPERAGNALLPTMRILDLRNQKLNEGLAPPLLGLLQDRLDRGEQSLVFLNRRGFAPVLMCYDCTWLAPCKRCDARLTLHKRAGKLRCHHCGADSVIPVQCPICTSANLQGVGEGTQRVETVLARYFPSARILRVDRDSTQRKGAFQKQLQQIQAHEVDILVGTQMLSKGHDFPDVTLVCVLNADQGLYSADFRSSEQLFQQIMQVSGRAGRADKPGDVWIQSFYPHHPLFTALCQQDYAAFADYVLEERHQVSYPPYAHLALLRAEAVQAGGALSFLQQAHTFATSILDTAAVPSTPVQITDPVPAPMERRAGRYRAQLLVQSTQRLALHEFLKAWLRQLDTARINKKVRWSLDVDPMSTY